MNSNARRTIKRHHHREVELNGDRTFQQFRHGPTAIGSGEAGRSAVQQQLRGPTTAATDSATVWRWAGPAAPAVAAAAERRHVLSCASTPLRAMMAVRYAWAGSSRGGDPAAPPPPQSGRPAGVVAPSGKPTTPPRAETGGGWATPRQRRQCHRAGRTATSPT